jgi:hypothetical protein
MDCIFPPLHKHEFVNARTCRCTGALAAEKKDDQILRMEIVAGGGTGGEWMSAAQGDEADFCIVAAIGLGGSACTKTSARSVELPTDELLIAGRRSGTVVV